MTKTTTSAAPAQKDARTVQRRQPIPADALNIAALRWYANRIENQALALYARKAAWQEDIQVILHQCVDQLDVLRQQEVVEDECPAGYHKEGNTCVPD